MEFLNNEQRDPRLNEILYPYFNNKSAQQIIDKYEPDPSLASEGWFEDDVVFKNFSQNVNFDKHDNMFFLSNELFRWYILLVVSFYMFGIFLVFYSCQKLKPDRMLRSLMICDPAQVCSTIL